MNNLIFFDLDNTFYNYKNTHEFAINEVYKNQKIYDSFENFISDYTKQKEIVHKRLKHSPSKHSKLIYFKDLFINKLEIKHILELERIYWASFIKSANINQKLINYIRDCKKKEDIFLLMTNQNTNVQMLKIEKWNLDFFNFIFTSEDIGYEKPNKKFFAYVDSFLENIDLNTYKTFAIGDDLHNDLTYWKDNYRAKCFLINNELSTASSKDMITVSNFEHAINEIY